MPGNVVEAATDAKEVGTAPGRGSGRDVRQPNDILANGIVGNQAKGRPRAREERLAAPQDDGMKVESTLVDATKVAQAAALAGGNGSRQAGSRFNRSCQRATPGKSASGIRARSA